jgi:hypothetical protein
MRWCTLIIVVMSGLISCSQNTEDKKHPMQDASLKADLQVIKGKRIYFGHQSVGFDLVAGMKLLSTEDPDVAPMFLSLGASPLPAGGFFADSRVGRNNYPIEKCDDFKANVERIKADSLDIALMKFCYADIGPQTNVEELFAYYVRTIDSLEQRYPRTTFVHVTVPYTLRTSAWKLLLKKMLGRDDNTESANYQRNRYNDLLMSHFESAPIMNLALVESTYPDGRRESFEFNNTTVYSLIEDYTYDGGHLNDTGKRLAARELIRTLANAIGKNTP